MNKSIVPIAIVHHANQYLITNGYKDRPGIGEIIGPPNASAGLRAVLDLHSQYNIPFHLHISGTFIEACAWFDPLFLEEIKELQQGGSIEIIGSSYAQNIMPLFDREHNLLQIQEELRLFQTWLVENLSDVTGFWVPERVWNTKKLSEVLRDPGLPNGGFQYVLVDDRLFLQKQARGNFDKNPGFTPELFEAHRIQSGRGLIALPLSYEMRLSIPFESETQEQRLDHLMTRLRQEITKGRKGIAIYGDDMEKVAGIPPWNPRAIDHYRRFLEWLSTKQEVTPVLLHSWLSEHQVRSRRTLESGTYRELATEFGAGEDYANWAASNAWAPYQRILEETWAKLKTFSSSAHPSSLLELAQKHFLACTYETAWHDAPHSIHSTPGTTAGAAAPTPWARALASHAKSTLTLLEAVKWAKNRDSSTLHAYIDDLDNDGHEEVILGNSILTAVITPRFGGRIVYLFSFTEEEGVLVVGNPSDDWNWLEECNDYMNVPMNHPGALADYGFEHDTYDVRSLAITENKEAELVIVNNQPDSPAFGLIKRFTLQIGTGKIHIQYDGIPAHALPLSLDIGLSPDYLRLLREGNSRILPYDHGNKRGFQNGNVIAWVSPESNDTLWKMSRNPIFGHGFCLGLTITASSGSLCLGVDTTASKIK